MLTLDPNDGRETGLRMKRRPLRQFPPDEAAHHPYASLVNDVIRRTYGAVMGEMELRAAAAYAAGLAIEDLGVEYTSEFTMDGPMLIKATATYRLVRQPVA